MAVATVFAYVASILVFSFLFNKRIARYYASQLSGGRVVGIDCLRGILATSVMAHHFCITYGWKNNGVWVRPESQVLTNMGSVPVSLFFMITGYLFIRKVSSGDVDFFRLFKSRFMRICPLYFLVAALVILITLQHVNIPLGEALEFSLKWLLFKGGDVAGFPSNQIIAGVQWTLAYEWVFYFSLPMISLLISRKIPAGLPARIIIFLSVSAAFLYSMGLQYKFFLLFLIGGIAAIDVGRFWGGAKFSAACAAALLIALIFTKEYGLVQMALVGFAFNLIARGCDVFGLLKSKALFLLGEISYSVYLLHGFVLYMAFSVLGVVDLSKISYGTYVLLYPLVFFAVVCVSWFSYKYVELIGISKPPMKDAEKSVLPR